MAEDRITSTKTATRSPQDAVPEAWKHFLRAHAAVMRQMDADLIALHGLTLSDYEVLLRLSQAPDRRMRRVDPPPGVVLTQSGITRLLAGPQRAGGGAPGARAAHPPRALPPPTHSPPAPPRRGAPAPP